VVLGCRTDHGRAADVDVLDGGRQVAAWLVDGGFERVQVDRNQVDRLDAVLVHDGVVDTATAEDAAVDFRVQGLDPTVHHFGETGVVRHFHCGNAVVLQQLEGPAGGEDLDAEGFSSRANSRIPVLSETLIKARRIGRRVVWSVISISIKSKGVSKKATGFTRAPFWFD
jgi:hypothetical protein